MEGTPERPKKLSELAEEIGHELGSGERMSEAEKILYLKKYGDSLRINADFVSTDTYRSLFTSLDLKGKTILNVGAGAAIGEGYNGVSPIIEALDSLDQEILLIPVDYKHQRTKSWNLLDTSDPEKDGKVVLEPVTADATALPFGNESVDGYLSTNLINEPRAKESEVVFVKKLFREAYRVLKPKGFLIVSSFGYFWWKTKEGSLFFNDAIDVEEIVTVGQIQLYLREAGFSHLESISLDDGEIREAIQERRVRTPSAVEAGVTEACAFLARK